MVMCRRVGDAEADRDDVEEGRLGQRLPGPAQIVARVKDEFVVAGLERLTGFSFSRLSPVSR